MSSRPFVCAVSERGFLSLRKARTGAWPFSKNIYEALKFRSEQEAVEWLDEKEIYDVELQYYKLPPARRRKLNPT